MKFFLVEDKDLFTYSQYLVYWCLQEVFVKDTPD